MAAFGRALDHGVDGIETDLRLSADGQLVLYHDRLAPDHTPVASLTRAELSGATGYEVPTLVEILDQWPEVFWNLEVKCSEAVPATVKTLRRYPPRVRKRILITSFLHDAVLECARQVDVASGFLAAHRSVDVERLPPSPSTSTLRAVIYRFNLMPILSRLVPPSLSQLGTIVWDFNVLDRLAVTAAKERGFRVYAYGVVNPDEFQLCMDWGLTGVITDEPLRVPGRMIPAGPGRFQPENEE